MSTSQECSLNFLNFYDNIKEECCFHNSKHMSKKVINFFTKINVSIGQLLMRALYTAFVQLTDCISE